MGVKHEAVDRGQGGEWVLEDLVPFGEDQIAADHDAAPLVAFGQEGEKDLHFLAALLDVAEIVEDDDAVAVQSLDQAR
jgi:hypothetical protein